MIFPSIYVMDIPDTFNSIVYATLQPTSEERIQPERQSYALRTVDVHPLAARIHVPDLDNLQPAPQHTIVFTDDLAPIEWMTNNLILDFILRGEMRTVQ